MLNRLHKPKHIQSNIPFGNNNTVNKIQISDKEIITTEHWNNKLNKDWKIRNQSIARFGYTWITQWISGNNFIITKFLDQNRKLVGYYWDITSPIIKNKNEFEGDDWYLDIWKAVNDEPILLDQSELTESLKKGYLSYKDGKIAVKTAQKILKIAKNSIYNTPNGITTSPLEWFSPIQQLKHN